MDLQPSPYWPYRDPLKRGSTGFGVAALQINLPVVVDGVFGRKTEAAVEGAQKRLDLVPDGIAGPETQRAIVLDLSAAAQRSSRLPSGLIEGLLLNESGFYVAAYSKHPSDDGYDLGAFQTSLPAGASQTGITAALDVLDSSGRWCAAIAGAARKYREATLVKPGYREDWDSTKRSYPWQLAVLRHNWPYAADNIAKIGRIFVEEGRDDRVEAWIEKATLDERTGLSRLHTPREWVTSYVEKALQLVEW